MKDLDYTKLEERVLANFLVVAVQFDNYPKTYHYKTMFENVEVGHKLVVDSPSGLSVVTVTDVLPERGVEISTKYELKWIVDTVNLSFYESVSTIKTKGQARL